MTKERAVADIDIWRAAKLTIDQQGAGAWLHAAMQIDALRSKGDLDGAAVRLAAYR